MEPRIAHALFTAKQVLGSTVKTSRQGVCVGITATQSQRMQTSLPSPGIAAGKLFAYQHGPMGHFARASQHGVQPGSARTICRPQATPSQWLQHESQCTCKAVVQVQQLRAWNSKARVVARKGQACCRTSPVCKAQNGNGLDSWDEDSYRASMTPRQGRAPPPPAPPGDGTAPSTQSERLRAFMSKLGMASMVGLPGIGMAAAAGIASGAGTQGGGGGPSPPAGPGTPTTRPRKLSANEVSEWGSDWTEDWDPEEDLDDDAKALLADEAEAEQQQRRTSSRTPRDKWITPLLDFRAVTGAVDPDQERTEDNLQGEALANKDESQVAIRYMAQLVAIPLLTGFVLSRALADPVLSFTLQNNSEAFAMTDRQKIEGAEHVHIEEARLRFDMAIGKLPPLNEEDILEHLREFASEVQEEERHHNEQNLITVVSDSISSIVLFSMISQQTRGRVALFNTLSRLFDGLSDIAKAVMIILIADTMLGYHSEEGWTGLIELLVGHYGFEAEEEAMVIFVGVVPVVIDVFFKYWIFIGLNRISPGAVITLKQIDTH